MSYRDKLRNPKRYQKEQGPMARMLNVAMSFGISMGISLFLMVKLGTWLDNYFHTSPYLMFVCVMVAILAGFRSLYREVLRLEEEEKKSEMEENGHVD